jgi:hypothetical protein
MVAGINPVAIVEQSGAGDWALATTSSPLQLLTTALEEFSTFDMSLKVIITSYFCYSSPLLFNFNWPCLMTNRHKAVLEPDA